MNLRDRILRHINQRGPLPRWWWDGETYVPAPADVGQCWIWTGKVDEKGYGRFRVETRVMQAHRVVWKATGRLVRTNEHLDHRCLTRNCVRPEHLEPVTPTENARRARLSSVLGVS